MEQILGFGAGAFGWGINMPLWLLSVLPLLIVWGLAWKGLALWHSAQRGQSWWFIALLLTNTIGILEIVYLFAFAKLKFSELFISNVRRS